jgi:hypothetical protein
LLFPLDAFATSAPSSLAATAISSSQINLTWIDNSSSETGYTFAYDRNSGLTSPTYVYAGGANTTSYSHTGRSPATTYYYKIKAEGNPDSAWSAIDSATTAPSGLAATATSNSAIDLTWTGNGNNSDIIGYTYARASNSSFSGATYHYVAGRGSTSATRTGLSTATTYWFKIKAEGTSDAFDSPYGTVVKTTTTPANLAASVISSSQINVSWTGNAGNSNIVGYTVAHATNSSFTGAEYDFVSGAGATSYSHTGLSSGVTYYYKVKAEGTSDSSDSAFTASISATAGGSVPNPPSGLTASVVSSSQINLSWTDNSTNETGFEVKRAKDSNFMVDVVWVGGIQGTTYASTGLSSGTTYFYKVRAQGTAGSSAYSNTVSATTPGPSDLPSGVPISAHFPGINAWMPKQIGSNFYNGKLETKWDAVEASGVKIMRYGGIGVDKHAVPSAAETRAQYVAMVDAMRLRGIEPVLQVPVRDGAANEVTPQQAADLVRYINLDQQKGVKYWSIGNEPNLGADHGGYGYNTAAPIAAYVKAFSSAMKAVDPTIKILAPETAGFHNTILENLTVCDGTADDSTKFDLTGMDPNGNYYVDILTFHTYGFGGTQTLRSQVIDELTRDGGFEDDLAYLKLRLDGCNQLNGRTGEDAVRIAVTEANVNHTQPGSDGPSGLGAASFIGGQFWAEMMGIAMQQGVDFITFWSVIEGGASHPDSEIGYFNGDGTITRPSYYHFQMMAQNFRGSSVAATEDSTERSTVKAFAAVDFDQVAVIILNQETGTGFDYTVRLNNGTVSGTRPLRIRVDAGLAVPEYNDHIGAESSVVLVFNTSGALTKKIVYTRSGHASASPPKPPDVF